MGRCDDGGGLQPPGGVHGAPVVELDESDLVLREDASPARLTRAQESDLPREVSIGFVGALARLLTRHGNRVGALVYGNDLEAVIPLEREIVATLGLGRKD
mgnify:CR=1 FL=1